MTARPQRETVMMIGRYTHFRHDGFGAFRSRDDLKDHSGVTPPQVGRPRVSAGTRSNQEHVGFTSPFPDAWNGA